MTQDTRSNDEIIMAAAKEMNAANLMITRDTLSRYTGLKLTIVDDRVKFLVDNGALNRVQRGVFEVAHQFGPSRIIFHAILPDGCHKLEIGDLVVDLNPDEARKVGHMLAGEAISYKLDSVYGDSVQRHNDLTRMVKDLRKDFQDSKSNSRTKGIAKRIEQCEKMIASITQPDMLERE